MKTIRHKTFHKKKRFNPRRAWNVFCISFLSVLVLLFGYFSWYFLRTTALLDEPATASLETNASKIANMEKMLQETESAVQTRTGNTPELN